MKKVHRIAGIAFLALVILVSSTQTAQAGLAGWLGFDIWVGIADVFAIVINWIVTLFSFLLIISGALLNFSINLTLRITEFVANSPAIFTTWKAIRDISGLFIIFFLLYAAIRMILGFDAKLKELVLNVVIAGVLINFSFFFTSLGIDASNIVSVQLYNAIAPANSLNVPINNPSGITSSLGDGGLSNIFMNSLDIQSYADKGIKGLQNQQQAGTGNLEGAGSGILLLVKIVLAGVVAIMIELVAALSFGAAAVAFIVRFVVLLMLLAFSPIWFALHILPKDGGFGEYAQKWSGAYKGMLLFMPVYLLLMYLALSVLTTKPSFLDGSVAANSQGYEGLIILAVNAIIVIVLINMPLLAALKISGDATKFINGKTLGAGNLWGKLGSNVGSRTLGRAAYSLDNSRLAKWAASKSPIIGSLTSAGLSKVSKAGFGDKKGNYEERLKAKKKGEEGIYKKLGTVERGDYKTTEAYDAAKARSKANQERYRENLPWSRNWYNPTSIIGFMVDNRANRQNSAKFIEEADKKKLLGEERTLRSSRSEAQDQLKSLKDKIEREGRGIGFAPGTPPSAEDLAKIKKLEGDIAGYDEKLDKIEETKEATRIDKIASGVATKSKEEGGGDKPEKKEEPKAA